MRDVPIGGPTPPLPVPPKGTAAATIVLGLLVAGAYAGLIGLVVVYRQHVDVETRHILERLADIEHLLGSGMLPETRQEMVHLRYDFSQMAHRLAIVELEQARIDAELSRIKPLFVPRKIPTK